MSELLPNFLAGEWDVGSGPGTGLRDPVLGHELVRVSSSGLDLARGFTHALVNAGGDSRVIGDRFGRPWIIGIRHPDHPDQVITRVPLVDSAFSTSGDYERYFDEDGVRYHHIIDPHTGHSASKVRSATVMAPTATQTDGLSKTAFVLGADEAMRIYNSLTDVDAILVTPEGRIVYSKGLEPAGPKGASQ